MIAEGIAEMLDTGVFVDKTGLAKENHSPSSDAESLFRDGDPTDRTVANARDTYNREVAKGSHQFREAMQDSMLSLKTLYEAILGKGKDIKDVPEYENAYISENALSSAVKAQQDEYSRKFGRPLIEALDSL